MGTISGGIEQIVQDQISLGKVGGVSAWNKFAFRPDIDTADGDALIIGDSTTNSMTILSTASTFTITYNQGTDGLGTTGALQLTFYYLDSEGKFAVSAHTLGDDGSDVTTFSGLGINRVAVSSSGSADINTSAITVTATTGGSVQAYVPALTGVTQQAIFHLPTNARGVAKMIQINAQRISGGASPVVTFKAWVYSRLVTTKFEVFRYVMDTAVLNAFTLIDPINFSLTQGDVLFVTASTTNDNTTADCRFSLNVYLN